MAYVIAEPCINTKDTACVNVCPVDCIHPKKDEAPFAGGATTVHRSRHVHRLRRVRAGMSGQRDLPGTGFERRMEILYRQERRLV